MMKIDKNNVEAHYLDYLEGNLSAENSAQLLSYINANKGVAEMLADADDILELELKPTNEQFGDLTDLKTFPCGDDEICADNIDDWLIAKTENTLSESEKQKVDKFVVEHNLARTELAIKSAYLKPNLNETFGSVAVLKKEGGTIIPLLLRISSIAAIFIFVWLVWSPEKTNRQYSAREINAIGNDAGIGEEIDIPVKESTKAIKVRENLAKSDKNGEEKAARKETFNTKKQPKKFNLLEQNFSTIAAQPEPTFNVPPTPFTEDFDLDLLFADLMINETNQPAIAPEKSHLIHNEENLLASNEVVKPKTELKEQYRPVTRALSNLTSLDMSYQKTPESAEVKQTFIKIGKFSYERKRKK